MLDAELFCVRCAQFGVVSTPAFAYIVKQRRDVKEARVSKSSRDASGYRETVGVVGAHETSSVCNDLGGVRINGIGVKQIELHLSNNRAEGWQVAPQNAVSGHSSQLFGHVVRYAKDL